MLRLWALRRSESHVVEELKQEQLGGLDEQWFINSPKYHLFFLIAVDKIQHTVKFTTEPNSPLGENLRCEDVC